MNTDTIMKIAGLMGKYRRDFEITVKGISMLPTLKEGDVIKIRMQDEYRVGDIIVYNYLDEGILVHRIVDETDSALICRGDNAIRLEQVEKDCILGKVVSAGGACCI